MPLPQPDTTNDEVRYRPRLAKSSLFFGVLMAIVLVASACQTRDALEVDRDCGQTSNVTINWGATTDSRADRYEVYTRPSPGAAATWRGWSPVGTTTKTYTGTALANQQFQIALKDGPTVYFWGPWYSLSCSGTTGGPNINSGQDGANLSYTPSLTDNFNNLNNWIRNDMSDGLHQAGNDGLNGKRWSAWYNAYQNEVATVSGGQLVMGGKVVQQNDSSRIAVQDGNLFTEFNRFRFYTGFVSTLSREYSNAAGTQVEVRPASGLNGKWGPGHFIEVDVNLSEMNSRAFRLSAWMMPAQPNIGGDTYDSNTANGVEIDLFEYEGAPGVDTLLQSKVISGGCGNTPNGSYNAGGGIRSGNHTIGLLWMKNRLVWYLDGVEFQRDTVRVPQVPHYLIISREMNSGAKDANDGIQSGDLVARPGVPRDPGLYATNVWQSKDQIAGDKGKVNSVKVWSVNDNTSAPSPTC